VLADGTEPDPEVATGLDKAGVQVRPQGVSGFRRDHEKAIISYADGTTEEIGGLFVATTFAQSAPFAEQLGLETLPSGGVRVDAFQRTSRPGVFAAGDMAHVEELPMPLSSVLTSAAAGLVAASMVVQELSSR
jgi:thioredoxin reductase